MQPRIKANVEPKQQVLPTGPDPRMKEVADRGRASHVSLMAHLEQLADIHRRMDSLSGVTNGA